MSPKIEHIIITIMDDFIRY